MAEYDEKWRTKLDGPHAWETPTHWYPPAVEIEAAGRKGAPNVFVRVEMRDGIPEVVKFSMEATEGGRAVRTADLAYWQPFESLALDAFRAKARPIENPVGDPVNNQSGPRSEAESWQIEGEMAAAQAARRGPSQAELENVARVYRQAIDSKPTEAVEVLLNYTRRTAARRIQQARAAGLLPPTTQGKRKAD